MISTYLDWAATAPPDPDALDYARQVALEYFGNPSSLHSYGKKAAELLAESRKRIAELLNCKPEQIYFTSGGSESTSIVFSQLLLSVRKGSILIGATEHPSVWETARVYSELGYPVHEVKPGKDGRISPDVALHAFSSETELISIMLLNNETGIVQDVKSIAAALRDARGGKKPPHIHTDAVQALGKEKIDLEDLGVDSASFSGHKIGAPRGIGILYLRRPIQGLFKGGGQEKGVRPGTENLPGIAALARVMEKRLPLIEEHREQARRQKTRLMEGLSEIPGVLFIPEQAAGTDSHISPFILKCSFPPVPGEVLQRVLSDCGYAVSTGSACSSSADRGRKKEKINRVLKVLGVSPQAAESSIRISLGPATRDEEIEAFVETATREIGTIKEQLG
ncbi:hypothetical protein B4O97_12320 [Marispirochaeta aestuarii]|uniref:Aminotransferase class V domain-containing protein n=1 Tax=Marispirochaeta aestuarii TaxID=1963862 RepID=A0A1Y1RWA7_9SPIO|nr:cysteine desulfurase family protein [Marispirochaeta aestuarii]ORC34425.1 hypothetical protein B4O97_12320 [Marispirochaeta aestuarii]